MPDAKISALPSGGLLLDTDQVPVNRAGVTSRVTTNLAALTLSVTLLATPVSALVSSVTLLQASVTLLAAQATRRLFQNITTVGLAASVAEQVLHTFDVPANTLVNVGDAIRIRTWIKCAGNFNNKGAKVYFGATVLGDSTQQTFNNVGFAVDAYVFRVSSSAQKAILHALQPNVNASWSVAAGGGFDDSAPAEDLTAPVTVKVTGISAVAGAANDIQALETVIDFLPAA